MTIPALTLPPVVPNRWSDAPDVFVNNTQAFLDWMSTHGNELGPWATSVAATVSGTDFNATSTTSLTVGTGSKTLTVQAGKLYQIGQFVIIAYTTTPANFMYGQVTAYNSVTGSLTVNVSAIGGSGTQTAWSVGLAPNASAYMPAAGGTFTDKATTATPAAGQESCIFPHVEHHSSVLRADQWCDPDPTDAGRGYVDRPINLCSPKFSGSKRHFSARHCTNLTN
jgi:hypothetical protein